MKINARHFQNKKAISIAIICWFLVICFLCLLPKNQLKPPDAFKIPHLDKVVHFTMYFVLSILLMIKTYQKFPSFPVKKIVLVFFICFFLGGTMEFLQSIPIINRSTDIFDQCFNSFGAVAGIFLIKRIFKDEGNIPVS